MAILDVSHLTKQFKDLIAVDEISGSILEDLWNRNLINLFASPLKFSEWLTSFLFLGMIKAAISFFFTALVAFLLFHVHIFQFGLAIIPLAILLIMSGWTIGFIIAGIVLRFGTKLQSLAWTMVWVVSPFSAVYYPISILPHWARAIAAWVPTSYVYVFEEARAVLASGHTHAVPLLMSLALSILYLGIALWFFHASFHKALEKGLVKLY